MHIKTNKPDIMTIAHLGRGDPLFWATMKDGKPGDYHYYDDNKKDYACSHHSTTGHGDPLFQAVQEQGLRTTKKPIHIEFLDDDGMEKWKDAMQQMIISDEDALKPIRTEFYGHGDPLMEDVMEARVAGDVMNPQEAFHQVEGDQYSVESKKHGDPLWDAIVKDPAWDKIVAGAIHREVSKEKAD
jgi:hypothetical protein